MTTYDDVKDLVKEADWFVTVTIPTPSNLHDARARFELEWRNARRAFSDRWDVAELEHLDELVAGLSHGDGEAVVIVHAEHGPTLVETLEEPVAATTVHEGPLPRLATVLESRQRTIAHVVVEADRVGADVTAFDGGTVLAAEVVEGSTEHIHRGHPGGWSQHRFQQRAENTWEHNAGQVADAVTGLARRVDAELVAVAGDVRAQTFILDSLPADVADIAIAIDVGSPAGIADEVVRQLSSIVAARVTAAAEEVRAGLDDQTASTDTATVVDSLRQGRVATLLVHDDGTNDGGTDQAAWLDGARLVDRAIAAALATDAGILIVPHLAILEGPVAATMRW